MWDLWQPFVPKPVEPVTILETHAWLDGGSKEVKLLDDSGASVSMWLHPDDPEETSEAPNTLVVTAVTKDRLERRRVSHKTPDEDTCREWLSAAIQERKPRRIVNENGHDWNLELCESVLRRLERADP